MDAVDRSELELLRLTMSGKMDRLTDAVNNEIAQNREFRADHEKRMRIVERWKLAIPGSAVLVVAAFLGGRVG
jgi:hypothetical protein